VGIDTEKNLSDFLDAAKVSEWAVPAMQWAVSAGLIQGRSINLLAPQEHITRAETAVILMRLRGLGNSTD
jgi:hypothetical protein